MVVFFAVTAGSSSHQREAMNFIGDPNDPLFITDSLGLGRVVASLKTR
jgi:hypothetical protein